MSARAMIERYLYSLANNDYQDVEKLIHADYEEYYPQTGELFSGRDTAVAVLRAYPGLPTGEVVGISGGDREQAKVTRALPMGPPVITVFGGDDAFTAELVLDYPGAGRYHLVVIGRVADGLIRSTRIYWAAPDEPAEWRAPFVTIVPDH